mmetsp:Transcript_20413/g.62117  ORF Transcript_20413/g.62117 Transcript_20413/m.62117 type:complete len:218 (+) Transcript_20413:180-833(+)
MHVHGRGQPRQRARLVETLARKRARHIGYLVRKRPRRRIGCTPGRARRRQTRRALYRRGLCGRRAQQLQVVHEPVLVGRILREAPASLRPPHVRRDLRRDDHEAFVAGAPHDGRVLPRHLGHEPRGHGLRHGAHVGAAGVDDEVGGGVLADAVRGQNHSLHADAGAERGRRPQAVLLPHRRVDELGAAPELPAEPELRRGRVRLRRLLLVRDLPDEV